MARKILLADDSVTAQNMGRKILADAGYEVTTVNNGSAALKRIAEQRPDLVVLDVYMPGYSGLEVCQRLKETGDTSRIPILLTVGKLEPFKPEEAKRVRADGFIVKPFEASELLSALSKLEDKIVPRAESSKPGRLARAAAALDDVPRDKTVAGEGDSGWKNRIAFPSKKKKSEDAEADDSAIYNPVNKDLRTVIEPRSATEAIEAKPEETKVDVGALAPEGLPKDVTPEEIAAIASAAAQIQGNALESKAEGKIEEVQKESTTETPEIARQPQAFEPVAATADEQAKVETASAQDASKAVEPESGVVEAVAAADVKQDTEKAKETSSAGDINDPEQGDVPVTMAVATGSQPSKPHWSAVAVALAPEEVGLSLEQEMQRAIAPAAPESPIIAEPSPVAETSAPVATMEAATPEPESPATALAEDAFRAEAAQTLTEIAVAATDSVRAAVKNFETVASAHVAQDVSSQAPSASLPTDPEVPVSETSTVVEQHEELTPVATEANQIEAEIQQPAPESFQPEEVAGVSEPAVPAAEVDAPVAQGLAPTVPEEQVPSSGSVASPSNGTHRHDGDNLAETTAAAWASWRRVRESSPGSEPSDSAAMAVAAGAEKSPEEALADNESDPAIASIVDSVLADLRPKIVEEISRKLGKKK